MVANNSWYWGLGLSAAAAMIYQVVAMNYLFFYFSQNTYSVATVISTFMIGLGLGAYFIHKYKKASKEFFIGLQLFVGVYALIIFTNLNTIIPLLGNTHIILTSTILLLPPTIALGTIFPLTARVIKANEEVGFIYATDLLGAVAGTLLAGFILIPEFGNDVAAIVAAIINFSTIFLVLNKKMLGITIATPVVVTLLFLNTTSALPEERSYTNNSTIGDVTFFQGEGERFSKQSPYGKISVKDNTLYINKRIQCTLKGGLGERELAALSLSHFERDDLILANIGLGCGESAAEMLQYTTKTLDIIEINPVILLANHELSNTQEHQKINIIVEEGLEYFRTTNKRYDAVLIDVENPVMIHSSNLYTKEAFETINKKLTEDGILGLWVYPCREQEYYDILQNTLKSVFPYAYNTGNNTMVASKKPLTYEEHNSTTQEINTLDNKLLSKKYFESCTDWFTTNNEEGLVVQ